jgi:hypothetical protein
MTLRSAFTVHSGQTVSESSVNDWRMSKAWPHDVQA